MKYSRVLLLLAVVVVLPTGLVSAQPAATAQLTVEVTNRTANGATVVGDEVTLVLYAGEQPLDPLQAKVGADGKAVFENVPVGQDKMAVARAKHQNMMFKSEPISLASAAGPLSASVEVFDVSNDTSKLSVGVHHIMVAVRGTSLEFREYLQLRNASDMAVVGPRRDEQNRPLVLEFLLPQGFKDLTASSYLEPEALVITPTGFYDVLAMPPGEHQVAFSYRVDIGRRTMSMAREIILPTAELMIFWEQGQGKLEGLGEPTDRLVNAAGVPLEYYRRSDLQPGETVTFQIAGFHVKESDLYTWIVLAAVFVVIVIVALLRLRPKPAGAGQRHA